MAKIDILNTNGQKLSSLTLSQAIFQAKINTALMAQAVRIYLANQRMASARTKTRNQIKVTKKKVWQQKGTGRARHGSRNAPIFVGGAKAHGPSGEQNFKLKFSRKMKQSSLFSALSLRLKDQGILVVSGLEKLKPQTKLFHLSFNKLVKNPRKLVLVLHDSAKPIRQGTKNLPYLTTCLAVNLTTYRVLNAQKLIFTKEGLKALQTHYSQQ